MYKFNWTIPRMGKLEGLFIAEEEELKAIMGSDIYFGGVLGKHSNIYGPLEEDDIVEVTDNQNYINVARSLSKSDTLCGYNPLDYYEPEDEE